jgi:hypothetical protein
MLCATAHGITQSKDPYPNRATSNHRRFHHGFIFLSEAILTTSNQINAKNECD